MKKEDNGGLALIERFAGYASLLVGMELGLPLPLSVGACLYLGVDGIAREAAAEEGRAYTTLTVEVPRYVGKKFKQYLAEKKRELLAEERSSYKTVGVVSR